jgi:deoxyribodipyrimidine photo-lyase
MPTPIILWYRADLRIHDHPALTGAIKDGDGVIPVFIFDKGLTGGRFPSSNRNRFLLESLQDLKTSLQKVGADLVIRSGDAATELQHLAQETGAKKVYYTADYSPYATSRDKKVENALAEEGIEARAFGGKLAVSALQKLTTKSGDPYKVFTPFWRQWQQVGRREVAGAPRSITMPKVTVGKVPTLASLTAKDQLSPDVIKGGETEGRTRLKAFLKGPIDNYRQDNNDMGADATSHLSAYLHFGCLSVREIETMLPDSQGAAAWHRQLAWRDFYYYILLHYPHPEREFQERYRSLSWSYSKKLLQAWKDGQTGYPAVDAAMRQLKAEGWMHNRGRLIVGSFLTKDLGLDWRDGERHFMEWLIDGDMANNNGNWQWIASVGVDPAPLFRRLYNPSSQRDRYDPSGNYVRTYVPELKQVPDKYLSEPWTMPTDEQEKAGCIIGTDYPAPVVDHKEARLATLARYRV